MKKLFFTALSMMSFITLQKIRCMESCSTSSSEISVKTVREGSFFSEQDYKVESFKENYPTLWEHVITHLNTEDSTENTLEKQKKYLQENSLSVTINQETSRINYGLLGQVCYAQHFPYEKVSFTINNVVAPSIESLEIEGKIEKQRPSAFGYGILAGGCLGVTFVLLHTLASKYRWGTKIISY